MTEAEAQAWVVERFGAPAKARLEHLAALVVAEAPHQNLIARSTLPIIWARHIVDSAQLVGHAETRAQPGLWLDIGTGAGFPGLVVALLCRRPVLLVEPRAKRAHFLAKATSELGLADQVDVMHGSIEAVETKAAVISARAVAPLGRLFDGAIQCARDDTLWILPKGQNARDELASAQRAWHGMFHVEQSITDPQSLVVLASGVSRR